MAKVEYSASIARLSGEVGETVYTRRNSGSVAQRKPRYKKTPTEAERGAIARLEIASARWNALTIAQGQAWNAYAQTLTRTNRVAGTTYHPTGFNVFQGLSCKYLQLHGGAGVPGMPPATSFSGDRVRVTVAVQPGGLLFIADRGNAPGVVTELLIQPLASKHRTPAPFYKHAAFATFSDVAPTFAVELPPGWYACAVRFVRDSTGEATHEVAIGVVGI